MRDHFLCFVRELASGWSCRHQIFIRAALSFWIFTTWAVSQYSTTTKADECCLPRIIITILCKGAWRHM